MLAIFESQILIWRLFCFQYFFTFRPRFTPSLKQSLSFVWSSTRGEVFPTKWRWLLSSDSNSILCYKNGFSHQTYFFGFLEPSEFKSWSNPSIWNCSEIHGSLGLKKPLSGVLSGFQIPWMVSILEIVRFGRAGVDLLMFPILPSPGVAYSLVNGCSTSEMLSSSWSRI